MKTFKTLDEQIQLLLSRNLQIDDEVKAKKYLLSNNYYNIINGYGKYFPRKGDCYTDGTTFEEVSKLYLFDKETKQAFFKAIIDVESHIKAIFAYRFAEMFPNKPYAYLSTECYARDKTLSVISTISRLSQIINRQQKICGTSINHYVNNHNDVPVWVLVNHLDFGELRNMLASTTPSLQNKVAKDFHAFIEQHFSNVGVFTPETMLSFIENINDVRNVCAHNNRLLGFKCRRDSKYWRDLHDNYGIISNDLRRSVFSVFISIQCFLSKMEYANLHNRIYKLVNSHLKKNLKTISVNEILRTLGFPDNWHCGSKLQATEE